MSGVANCTFFAIASTIAVGVALTAGAAPPDAGVTPADALPRAAGVAAAARERATGRATERGLTWLAGEWEKGADEKDAMGRGNIAVASLAGLAFLADGAHPGRGRFGTPLRNCLDFVSSHAQATGLIATPGAAAPMYQHGYATLFLAESVIRTGDPELRKKLTAAVKVIEKAQSKGGGWRYLPTPLDGDISVTACQLVALSAAMRAGADVNPDVIAHGVKYVEQCQNDDGGFKYMLGTNGGASGYARTAAALAVFARAGQRQGDSYAHGLHYLTAAAPAARPPQQAEQLFFFYGAYYAAQALADAPGDDDGARVYNAVRDQLVQSQQPDGSWKDSVGANYATASALIALQLPDGRLDVLKGAESAAPATRPAAKPEKK